MVLGHTPCRQEFTPADGKSPASPAGPPPSHFSQNQGEAGKNALHGRGSELGWVSLLSGFNRIVPGCEAHLSCSVLISFGFLSFYEIKVLLLLRLRLCLCGVTGIDEPKEWE